MGHSQRTLDTVNREDMLGNSAAHDRGEVAANMADNTPKKSDAPFATRIDPNKESLSPEQMYFIKQVEREQWKKRTQKLRGRNIVTGLAIGALVLGIYGYTFFSVSQEHIIDDMDQEARRARLQEPKTGAN